MSKDKRERTEPRTGSVTPQDEGLTAWIAGLWDRSESPERIEVWQVFPPNKSVRGQMIHHVDFKHGEKLDAEGANHLANEIIAVAQHDCNCVERKSNYEIAVIDKHRRSEPIVRRLGPLWPTRTMLAKPGETGRGHEEEDEESPLSGRTLAERHISAGFEHVRWEQQRNDKVIGDVLMLLAQQAQEQRVWNAQMQKNQMDFFMRLQDAEDRRLDRDVRRKTEETKAEIMRDVVRLIRNLVPGMLNAVQDGGQSAGPGLPSSNKAEVNNYGPSPERMLCENILTDCEETGLSVKLFGDWKADGDRVTPDPDKPGIFTPHQFAVLFGVKEGRLPPTALDALLPDSGDKRAVTEAQAMQAIPLMPEGIGIAFRELLKIRTDARQKAAAKTA